MDWSFLFSNPRQFDMQIYSHIIFSVTICVIYFIYMTGLCKMRKQPISEGYLIPLVLCLMSQRENVGKWWKFSWIRRNVVRNQIPINQLVPYLSHLSPTPSHTVIEISISSDARTVNKLRNSETVLALYSSGSTMSWSWRISGPRT